MERVVGTVRTILWIGAFLLTGTLGTAAQTVIDQSFPRESSIDLAAMHRLVSADFLAPSSAQYKGMSLVTRYDGHQFICGWVNAKNSFGGYTPFYPFYVDVAYNDANVGDGYKDELSARLVLMPFNTVGCLHPLGLTWPE